MASLDSYRLSDEESQHIFLSEILPAELPAKQPSGSNTDALNPLALLAIGQTGAGKSRLSGALLPALERRRADKSSLVAHLIADTFKTYHPHFSHLMATTPHLASSATGYDARRWLAMAAREVVSRRIDVLLESACRHPDDFSQLALIFREAGYRIAVLMLAVPAPLSRLGILVRFYEKLPEAQSRGLPVRLTPIKVHDESYAGLSDAAAFLDKASVADQILVIRRGNLVAYGETRIPNDQVSHGNVARALERERERPLTRDEIRTALEDIDRLTLYNEASDQLQQILAVLHSLIVGCNSACENQGWPELLPLQFAERGRHTGSSSKVNILHLGAL